MYIYLSSTKRQWGSVEPLPKLQELVSVNIEPEPVSVLTSSSENIINYLVLTIQTQRHTIENLQSEISDILEEAMMSSNILMINGNSSPTSERDRWAGGLTVAFKNIGWVSQWDRLVQNEGWKQVKLHSIWHGWVSKSGISSDDHVLNRCSVSCTDPFVSWQIYTAVSPYSIRALEQYYWEKHSLYSIERRESQSCLTGRCLGDMSI